MGGEHSLGLADLAEVAPDIHKTIKKMQHLVRQRDAILANSDLSVATQNEEVNCNETFTRKYCKTYLFLLNRSRNWSLMVVPYQI